MQHIPLDKEIKRFRDHLMIAPRVIFSAKFGDGKTTFLKEFKESEVMSDYEFFTIHPINYSVAKNEDVFEYIKRDILLQFANRNLLDNFDLDAAINTIYNWQTLYEALSFILQFVPHGESILKLIDRAKEARDKYQRDKKTWQMYDESFKSQRGGIYEVDGYTMLIKSGINIIHTSGKKTCLIIEDLDRIDPGHLFRILNVLGAHVDEENGQNKFGFSNIVAVMDYDVTKHIFHHFYGEAANYDGYMSKFTSKYVYYFSINETARLFLYDIIKYQTHLVKDKIDRFVINVIANTPVTVESVITKMSVRDIAKIIENFSSQIDYSAVTIRDGQLETDAPVLSLLAIFKRMQVKLSNLYILDSIIESGAAIGLLGNFLCVNDAVFSGVAIPYDGSHYVIGNSDNGKMIFLPVGQSYPDSPEAKIFIKNAFDKATMCIRDWNC